MNVCLDLVLRATLASKDKQDTGVVLFLAATYGIEAVKYKVIEDEHQI